MYRCFDCNQEFKDPKVEHTSYRSYYCLNDAVNDKSLTLYTCPFCGSELIEKRTEYDVDIRSMKAKEGNPETLLINYSVYNEDDDELVSGITEYEGINPLTQDIKDYILELEGLV